MRAGAAAPLLLLCDGARAQRNASAGATPAPTGTYTCKQNACIPAAGGAPLELCQAACGGSPPAPPPPAPQPPMPPPAPKPPAPGPGPGLFNCHPVTPAVAEPQTVDELHPGHVSVVMALGDSITAAFAANGGIDVIENRDISWSIGQGSQDHLTMPYIMQNTATQGQYALYGQSTAAHIPEPTPPAVHAYPGKDHLNGALSAAVASQLLSQQVPYLKTQAAKVPDIKNRWKVLTIWIGANDLCPTCASDAISQAKAAGYYNSLDSVLSAVLGDKNLGSKIYINLWGTMQLSSLEPIQQKGLCKAKQGLVNECPCVTKAPSAYKSKMLDDAVGFYNDQLARLAKKWHRTRPDVGVVYHAALDGQRIPAKKWISTTDCFHPSALAHQSLGVSLWNAMLGDKGKWRPDATVRCPTPDSVLSS